MQWSTQKTLGDSKPIFLLAPFVCHSAAQRRNLLFAPNPNQVFAVIVNAVKDPEEFHSPQPLKPFTHTTSLLLLLKAPVVIQTIANRHSSSSREPHPVSFA